MAWKMVGEPKVRRVTRTLSDEFSQMTPAPNDRHIGPTRSSIIRRAFDMKRFRTCEWASAYCAETKQTYRVNGKHTSTILSSMNGEFPKDLSVIVEHYHCDTLEDVASLYATFDIRACGRSTGDINRSYAASVPELANLTGRIINLAVTGISYALWEETYCQHPPEDRAQLAVANKEFVVWLDEIMGSANAAPYKHLRRSPVVAVMFMSYKKSKAAATEFWTAVRDETGAKPDLPDRRLAKLLLTGALHHRKADPSKKSILSREMLVKCIHYWNAWRRKETTTAPYYADAKTPAPV
jgi:hypothetical protein